MMNQGGMLIRLIDIVFILLFGFISISEISDRSKIALPKSENMPQTPPDTEKILIVGVAEDGGYLVENERVKFATPLELKTYLQAEKDKASEAGSDLRVRVRPNWNTPIKFTMYVASICDELSLTKGMDVKKAGRSGI